MPDRKLPPELIRSTLEKWVTKVCRDLDADPVIGLEAVDVIWDPTLTYYELKKALEEELGHRGIVVVAPEVDSPEWRRAEELPPYLPPEELRRELEEFRSERDELKRRLSRLIEEKKRWKKLREEERSRLVGEIAELRTKLGELVKIPPKPPEVKPPKPPRVPRVLAAKFSVGSFVEHQVHGAGVVKDVKWNEAFRRYEYMVEWRK